MVVDKYVNVISCNKSGTSDYYIVTFEFYNNLNTDDASFIDFYVYTWTIHQKNLSVNCVQKLPAESLGTTSGGVLEFNANGETFLSINDSYMCDLYGSIQQFDAKFFYDNLEFITNNI
jgi:hypothetical protein